MLQARRHLTNYPNNPHSNIKHDRKTKNDQDYARSDDWKKNGENTSRDVVRDEMVAWEARQDKGSDDL